MSSLVTILFWKLVRSCFFVEEREAGSNLSRWQRKQVIWKKNLSYSDEWTTVELEEETHVACCLPFRTAFQFFLPRLAWGQRRVTHGDLQMIISWQAKDHPTQSCYSSCSYNPIQFSFLYLFILKSLLKWFY